MADIEKTTITVKGVEAEAWKKAAAAADRRDESRGAWLSRACYLLAEREAGDLVIMPDQRPDYPITQPLTQPVIQPETLLAIMQAAQATGAAAGVPVPKTAARHAFAILTGQLRAARGLPPLAPRRRVIGGGETRVIEG